MDHHNGVFDLSVSVGVVDGNGVGAYDPEVAVLFVNLTLLQGDASHAAGGQRLVVIRRLKVHVDHGRVSD